MKNIKKFAAILGLISFQMYAGDPSQFTAKAIAGNLPMMTMYVGSPLTGMSDSQMELLGYLINIPCLDLSKPFDRGAVQQCFDAQMEQVVAQLKTGPAGDLLTAIEQSKAKLITLINQAASLKEEQDRVNAQTQMERSLSRLLQVEQVLYGRSDMNDGVFQEEQSCVNTAGKSDPFSCVRCLIRASNAIIDEAADEAGLTATPDTTYVNTVRKLRH